MKSEDMEWRVAAPLNIHAGVCISRCAVRAVLICFLPLCPVYRLAAPLAATR